MRTHHFTVVLIASLLLGIPVMGEELPAGERGTRVYPAVEPNPDNRCLLARYYLRAPDGVQPLTPAQQRTLGDDLKGVLDLPDGAALELYFIGAARWINEVALETDGLEVRIDYLDLQRQWQPFATQAARDRGLETVLRRTSVRALGLRIAPRPAQTGRAVRIAGPRATFEDGDPDATGGGTFQVFLEGIKRYYPNAGDLANAHKNVDGLSTPLVAAGWTKDAYVDFKCWEKDWKVSALTNFYSGNEDSYSDAADLAFFHGHGNADGSGTHLLFGRRNQGDCCLHASDAYRAWGDKDLEWAVLHACRLLRDTRNRNRWANAMNGLHTLIGWETVLADVKFGGPFGDRLVSTGPKDPAEDIVTAHAHTAEEVQRRSYIAWYMVEDAAVWSDFAWGQGPVAADPAVDNLYATWMYKVRTTPPPEEAPGAHDDETTAVRIEPRGPTGLSVVFDARLLAGNPGRAVMPRYEVIPDTFDTAYVEQMAGNICSGSGKLCSADIGPTAEGEINALDGAWVLRVDATCGAPHLQDTENWFAWQATAPTLPDDDIATATADNYLTQLQLRPPGAAVVGVGRFNQAVWERVDPNVPDPDPAPIESFDVAVRVDYERYIDAGGSPLRVVGPGGHMSVTLGDGGALQRVFRGAWRHLAPGPDVDIVPLTDVLNALATAGFDACVEGLIIQADEIIVQDSALGYYESSCRETQTVVRPVYILTVQIREAGTNDFVDAELYVYADAPPLDAQLTTPLDAPVVDAGATVCFAAEAMGGVPPYDFVWESDLQGLLGTGPAVCAPLDAVPTPGKSSGVHAVTCTVTDSMGTTRTLITSVTVFEARPWLSEILFNPPGSDAGAEWIEVVAPRDMPLSGHFVIVLHGTAGQAGTVAALVNLADYAAGGNRLLLARDLATTNLLPPSDPASWVAVGALPIGLPNGSATYVLARGAPLFDIGADLDLNDDGLLDAGLPGFTPLDAVSFASDVSDREYAGELGGTALGSPLPIAPDALYRLTSCTGTAPLGWAGGRVLGTPGITPLTWDLNATFGFAHTVDPSTLTLDGGLPNFEICETPIGCLGDTNCDGAVTFADIDPFVARLGCPVHPACIDLCPWQAADVNQDGSVDIADIDPFVGTLGTMCR